MTHLFAELLKHGQALHRALDALCHGLKTAIVG
jgi:hypothetical protein